MKELGNYYNGNYHVRIFNDGTKIRFTKDDEFIPSFSENIDLCITKKCQQNCCFCYENCSSDGKHSNILNQEWIKTLHPYTELAINGNDLDHPDLDDFLRIIQKQGVIVNITVNQNQFFDNIDKLTKWQTLDLIKGIGISLVDSYSLVNELPKYHFDNIVIHTINGILSKDDIEYLKQINAKVLILGYKDCGRGTKYLSEHNDKIKRKQQWLKDNIISLIQEKDGLNVISFDNLAIEQLDLENQIKEKTDIKWDEFYMGNDGQFTFYIDAIEQTFAKNSILHKTEKFPIENKSIDDMFKFIRNYYNN